MHGVRVLDRMFTKARYFNTQKAFTKWHSLVRDQNFAVRLNAICQMTAKQQQLNSLFYAWRH